MPRSRPTPLGALVRGWLAGAAGTVAMDCLWYRRYRRGGAQDRFLDWELSAGLRSFEDAPAPAQVGRRLIEGLFQVELRPEHARLVNVAMHWSYGVCWGGAYGVVAGSAREPRVVYGIPFGSLVFAGDYVLLPLAGAYRPIWEYDAHTLWDDLSAHLVYGLGTAAAFWLLVRR